MKVNFKFDVDDEVWYIWKSKVIKGKIKGCYFKKHRFEQVKTEINYLVDGVKFPFPEADLFESKEKLLASL